MLATAQYRRNVLAVFWLFALAVVALTALVIYQTRSTTLDAGLKLVALQSRQFEDLFTQSAHTADVAIDNVQIRDLSHEELGSATRDFLRILRQAPYIRSLSVLNDDNKVIASSNPSNLDKVIDVRNFYPVVPADRSVLRIGRPWMGRDFADGTESTPQNPVKPDSRSFIPIARSSMVAGQRCVRYFQDRSWQVGAGLRFSFYCQLTGQRPIDSF